jgi:hypothetical protein
MSRRKGEITEKQSRRQWPHQVALPAERVRSATISVPIYGLAKTLGGAPRPYHLRRDDHELVVFCFATMEAAQVFLGRFGGDLLPTGG